MTPFHLDDEALSAAVDGETTSEEQAHLDGCASCQERFDQLRSVALAVGTPVPGRPGAAAEAAILAALGTTPEHEQGGAAAESSVTARGPALVPSSRDAVSPPVGRLRAGSRRAGHSPGESRLRRHAELALAAAAVAAVVLGVGLLAKGSGRGSSSHISAAHVRPGVPAPADNHAGAGAAAPRSPASPGSASRVPSAASATSPGAVDGAADLGDQTDPAALARIVDARLAALPPNTSPELSTRVPIPLSCVNQGAAAVGLAGDPVVLRYLARVRWQGQDAVVLVFDRPAGGVAGVVMRQQDCATLTMLSL
jgi:negative regulator of sigma E activity